MANELRYTPVVDKVCGDCEVRSLTNKNLSSVTPCTHSPSHRPADILTSCPFVKDDYHSFLCSINEMPDVSDVYDIAASDNTNIEQSTGITVSSTARTAKNSNLKDCTDAEITRVGSNSDFDTTGRKALYKGQQMYYVPVMHSRLHTGVTRNAAYETYSVIDSVAVQSQRRLFTSDAKQIDLRRKVASPPDCICKRSFSEPLSCPEQDSLSCTMRRDNSKNFVQDDYENLPYHVDFDAEGNLLIVSQAMCENNAVKLSTGGSQPTGEGTYRSTVASELRQGAELLTRQSSKKDDSQATTLIERLPQNASGNRNTNPTRRTLCPQPPCEAPRSPQRSIREVRDSPAKMQQIYKGVEAKHCNNVITQHTAPHSPQCSGSSCVYVDDCARAVRTPTKSPSPTSIANSNSTIAQSRLSSMLATHVDGTKDEQVNKLDAHRTNVEDDVNHVMHDAGNNTSKATHSGEGDAGTNRKHRTRQSSESPNQRQCTIPPEDHDRERLTALRAQARQRISPFIACDQSSHLCRSRNSTLVSRTTDTPFEEQISYGVKPALTLPQLFKDRNDMKSFTSNARNSRYTAPNVISVNTQAQPQQGNNTHATTTKVATLAECTGDSYFVMSSSENCSPRKLQNIREWACNAWPSNATEQSANSMNSSAAISAIATQAARDLARTPHSQSSYLQQTDTIDACSPGSTLLTKHGLPRIESAEQIQSTSRDRLALVLHSANRKCGTDTAKTSAPHFTFDIRVDNRSSTPPKTLSKSQGLLLDNLAKGENHSTPMASSPPECESYLQSVDDIHMTFPTSTPTIPITENDVNDSRYFKFDNRANDMGNTHKPNDVYTNDDSNAQNNNNSLHKKVFQMSQRDTDTNCSSRRRNLCNARLQDFMLTPTPLDKDVHPAQLSSSYQLTKSHDTACKSRKYSSETYESSIELAHATTPTQRKRRAFI